MARHKDANWNLHDPPTIEGAAVAVLMDIRDELKELNRLLRCPNFQRIPHELSCIRRQTNRIPPRPRGSKGQS
jgi:hypothetical protein